MARQRQKPAQQPEPSHSNGGISANANGESANGLLEKVNGKAIPASPLRSSTKQAGILELLICTGGIYASFLSWALLQERITTTTYGPPGSHETFTYSVVLNTIQSAFAALTGYLYLLSSRSRANPAPIFPSGAILAPLGLVAVTSSLASPFGYASLKHIDYITFILAKSCKLLPVMALQISVFRKRYPLYKYAVVALVTAGVAVFTLHHPSSAKKRMGMVQGSSVWGLTLLSINLLFDGLTNSTQDHIFASFKPYTGPQLMCAQNILCTGLTVAYLLLSPYLAQTGIGAYIGLEDAAPSGGELADAISFIRRHPSVGWDVLGFAACGAVGQVFIFYTLANFSSLLLVTVTVTRKMLTMILSVIWFGHRLSNMQWLGVGLVFGGIGAEALIQRSEKLAKEKAKALESRKVK